MEATSDQSDAVASDAKTRRRMPMKQREEVRKLLSEGLSRRQIARNMGVSPSVISRLDKKLQETGTVEDRHRVGRPRLALMASEHWTLLDHVQGEYKFQCKYCEKLFVHQARIREHLRTHTGERPFKCDQCLQAFATTNTLNRHSVTHTDDRPFMCDFCSKQFADSGTLRIHIRIHTGDKPYKCSYCDRRCITKGNLNAHMRIHRNLVKTSESKGAVCGSQRKEKILLHDDRDTWKKRNSDNSTDKKIVNEETRMNNVISGDDIIEEMNDEHEERYHDHIKFDIINGETDKANVNQVGIDAKLPWLQSDAKLQSDVKMQDMLLTEHGKQY